MVCALGTLIPTSTDEALKVQSLYRDSGKKLIGGMVANGYTQEFAEKTFSQLEGFGSYGFPESHAASFALIVYASFWLKCHGRIQREGQVVHLVAQHPTDLSPELASVGERDRTFPLPHGRR
jgi:hypothetical protein